ncbi:unnamed protein product [Dicrocoelium dendriticum]|nr:unnamed protein product [Dicrocoelium dendriticum]
MSTSYSKRDPLLLSPASIQTISSKSSKISDQSEYTLSFPNQHRIELMNGDVGQYIEQTMILDKPGFSIRSHMSIQSPKMSPDSTLTHPPLSTCANISHLPHSSPGLCVSGSTQSSLRESSLRSALTDTHDRQRVGSSDSSTSAHVPSMQLKSEHSRPTYSSSPVSRSIATAVSNASRPCTPNSAGTTPNSGSVPSSTTPVKKSSRRNPWGSETYSDLITVAIHSYPDQQATLQQIYDFIITHYDYFRERSDPTTSAGWKNSIRHNLSLHDRFTKCPKSSDNTKSSYWRINTDVAARPYIRRRACSMDTNNRKRPGKSGSRGSINGLRGVRHSGSHNGTSLTSTSGALGTSAAHVLLPSLCEMQCVSLDLAGDGGIDECGRSRDFRFYPKPFPSNEKMTGYLPYAPSLPQPFTESDVPNAHSNGNRWSSYKTSSSVRSMHSNTTTSTSYSHDHLPNNLLFDPTEFHSVAASTDQALVRSRASSLIEHLLRTDPSAVGSSNEMRGSTSVHLPQSYLPNTFLGGTVPHSTNNLTCVRSSSMDQPSHYFFTSSLPQPHPVDMRPHSMHTRSTTPEACLTDTVADHPILPLHLHSTGHHPASSFHLPWQHYTSPYQLPVGAPSTSLYSGFSGTSGFSIPPVNASISPLHDETQSDYEATSSKATSLHTGNPSRFLPFLVNSALSPSTNSSTSSSTKSWRPPQLTLSGSAFTSATPIGHTSAVVDGRSFGPLTPPTSLYYSPLRQPLCGAFESSECALDTPPYHHIKPEPLPEADEAASSRAASSEDTDGIGILVRYHSSTSYPTCTQSQGACGTMSSRFGTEFNYEEDEDRDKLELELSLELADRIVGSTRSSTTTESK